MTERLTLTAALAAAHLGISVRLLREQTTAGRIPHVRIGARVVYPIAALEQFLAEQAAQSVKQPPVMATVDAPRRRRRIVQPVSTAGGVS